MLLHPRVLLSGAHPNGPRADIGNSVTRPNTHGVPMSYARSTGTPMAVAMAIRMPGPQADLHPAWDSRGGAMSCARAGPFGTRHVDPDGQRAMPGEVGSGSNTGRASHWCLNASMSQCPNAPIPQLVYRALAAHTPGHPGAPSPRRALGCAQDRRAASSRHTRGRSACGLEPKPRCWMCAFRVPPVFPCPGAPYAQPRASPWRKAWGTGMRGILGERAQGPGIAALALARPRPGPGRRQLDSRGGLEACSFG